MPATVTELAVWCGAAGIGVRRLDAGGIERPWRPSWITRVSHVALQFLARYQTRPLHFFGSLGAAFAALGVAGGLGIKCSAMDGPARYLLMELALGFAVAGMELFVAGLVGELLAYLRSAIEADRGGPPEN